MSNSMFDSNVTLEMVAKAEGALEKGIYFTVEGALAEEAGKIRQIPSRSRFGLADRGRTSKEADHRKTSSRARWGWASASPMRPGDGPPQ